MIVNYSDEPVNRTSRSIFLAGPTPRKKEVQSWRPDALKILDALGYTGVVYVPERKTWAAGFDYDTQVEWEWSALDACGTVAFWIPRQIPDMPAFTTNVEFGMMMGSGKVLYGRPDNAVKCGYLDRLFKRFYHRDPANSLHNLMTSAFWTIHIKEG